MTVKNGFARKGPSLQARRILLLMATKRLTIVFRCALTQLSAAAERTLGLRNLIDANSIMENLLHTVPHSDAIQSLWCQREQSGEDEYAVTLRNHASDDGQDGPASEPSDPTEFQNSAKALQELIFSKQSESSASA
jgi:hypothetical protein